MLKALGLLLIVCGCAGTGWKMGQDVQKRSAQLSILKKMMLMLSGEIKFAQATLPEAFMNISSRLRSPFSDFLVQVSKELDSYNGESFSKLWERNIEEQLSCSSLTKADRLQLARLGESMGYLDIEMQQNTISLYVEQLEQEIEAANSTLEGQVKLYRCLGIMAGLFLVVLII